MIRPFPFSILARIEGTATTRKTGAAETVFTFSILARIEGTATGIDAALKALAKELSVSSHGSKGLQPRGRSQYVVFWVTFSILARIEGTATKKLARERQAQATFSILARIEGTATDPLLVLWGGLVCFQYPRTDRRDCNTNWSV